MQQWAEKLDAFLTFNERDVLTHAGKLSAELAEQFVHERYEAFDAARREAELMADTEDPKTLEALTKHTADSRREPE